MESNIEVFFVDEKVVVPVVPERITRANAEATYRYNRESPKSATPSRKSSAASPTLSGLDDVYSGNLDDDWPVDTDDGGATTCLDGRSLGLNSSITVTYLWRGVSELYPNLPMVY